MDTCCWMSSSTCCARGNVTFPLQDLQDSLGALVSQGLSRNCYFQLANLECSLCSPDQEDYITYGGSSGNDFDDQRWIIRICENFCTNLFNACANDNDAHLLQVNARSVSHTDFCEGINGQALANSDDLASSIFGGAHFVVSEFTCYQGVSASTIQQNVGVCLTSHADLRTAEPRPVFVIRDSASAAGALVSSLVLLMSVLALWL